MIEIIPAILTSDPAEAREMLRKCEGVVKRVQIDIIDGKFADNRTIFPEFMEDVSTSLLIDYHLMVDEPINWVERCIKGQGERIIGQIEKMSDQTAFVGEVQKVGRQVGLAIDIDTPVSELDPVILTNLDVVLVMNVPAGFGGQDFNEIALKKISKLDEIRARDDTPFRICDDGGITKDKIGKVREELVDEVSIGRRLFDGDLKENVAKFMKGHIDK